MQWQDDVETLEEKMGYILSNYAINLPINHPNLWVVMVA